MSDKITKLVKEFDAQYSAVIAEQKASRDEFYKEYVKLVEHVWPVVEIMKKHKIFFFHPDLPTDIRATQGPIIARNIRDIYEVYVLTEKTVLCKTTSGSSDTQGKHMALSGVLEHADKEFALKGLTSLSETLNGIMDKLKDDVANTNLLTQRLAKNRENRALVSD